MRGEIATPHRNTVAANHKEPGQRGRSFDHDVLGTEGVESQLIEVEYGCYGCVGPARGQLEPIEVDDTSRGSGGDQIERVGAVGRAQGHGCVGPGAPRTRRDRRPRSDELAGGTVESNLDLPSIHTLGVVDLHGIDAIHIHIGVEKEITTLNISDVRVPIFELRALLSARRALAVSFGSAKGTFRLDVLGCDGKPRRFASHHFVQCQRGPVRTAARAGAPARGAGVSARAAAPARGAGVSARAAATAPCMSVCTIGVCAIPP